MKRCGWGTDKVIRLFRRDVARYQDREVHAEIDLPGPLPVLRNLLEHHSFRSFGQYWRKIQIYSEWGAARLYREGKRAGALQIFGRPVIRFFKMYVVRLGFLEGLHGLVLSMLGAFTVYLKYARLWEMEILKGAFEVPAQVEAGGPLASEQIGRMVDEESRSAKAEVSPRRGPPGQTAQPR